MSIGTIPYTSVDRIFSKIKRDYHIDFSEGDVIEWTAEALEAIGAVRQYEEAVAFIEVRNHQFTLPRGLHGIIQIARNNCWTESTNTGLCANNIVSSVSSVNTAEEEPASCPVVLDCNGQPLQEYDLAYYRPYFDLQYEYGLWRGCRAYQMCFTPVRLSTNSFFNSIVCQESDSSLYSNCEDEYTIIEGTTVRTSFQTGQVALAYLRQVVDEETGYPKIPDHFSYTTAITKYIMLKITERDFYANRQGSESRVSKAESDWHWYCKQAGNLAMITKGVDEHENAMRQRNYMIPQTNRYYGFFGRLAHAESRKFNDADNRNSFNQFRGIS